jgi:hypothetical protein
MMPETDLRQSGASFGLYRLAQRTGQFGAVALGGSDFNFGGPGPQHQPRAPTNASTAARCVSRATRPEAPCLATETRW